MRKNGKRLGAMLLTLVMVLSMVPVTALGAGETDYGLKITPKVNDSGSKSEQFKVKLLDFGKTTADGAADATDADAGLADGIYEIDFKTGSELPASLRFLARYKDELGFVGVTYDVTTSYTGWQWHYSFGNGDFNGTAGANQAGAQRDNINFTQSLTGLTASTAYTAHLEYSGKTLKFKFKAQGAADWSTEAEYTISDEKTNVHTDKGGFAVCINQGTAASAVVIQAIRQMDADGNLVNMVDYTDYNKGVWNDSKYAVRKQQRESVENTAYATVELSKAPRPEYTTANINAGLFDVGTTPTQSEDGTWTANYSNPMNTPENTKAGWVGDVADPATDWDKLGANVYTNETKVKAHAPSWNVGAYNDYPPYVAVDGDYTSAKQAHTNYGDGAGPNYNGSSFANEGDKDLRFIQLEVTVAGGDVWELAGIRIVNAQAIPTYTIQVSTTGEDGSWTTVKTGSNLGSSSNWQYISFDQPTQAKYVRLCRTDDGVGAANGHLKIKEIHLVKNGTPPEFPVTGKITSDGTTALEGATVMLVQENTDHNYNVVPNLTDTTKADGTYKLDLASLNPGGYRIRVSMPDRGAKISDKVITLTGSGVTENGENNDLTLAPFDDTAYQAAGYSIKTFTFNGVDDAPTIANGATTPEGTSKVESGQLVLTFTGHNRQNNLMRLAGTPLKNGEVEFDVTRTDGNDCRFGLGLRVGAGKQTGESDFDRWLYVGQFAGSTKWGYEYWNATRKQDDTLSSFWSRDFSGPSFKAGETRHIKVKVEDSTVSLWVDGIAVINNATLTENPGDWLPAEQYRPTPPTAAGDAGFLYGGDGTDNDGCAQKIDTIKIDNLRVVRFDPSFSVTVAENITGGTLTYTDKTAALNSDGKAAVGDVIKVTGTATNTETHALESITLTKTSDSSAVTDVTVSYDDKDHSFSFPMPNYDVTVSGTFLPKLTEVTITKADGTALADKDLKVGKTLKATVTAPAAADNSTVVTDRVTYEWAHGSDDSWTTCKVNGAADGDPINAASRELFNNDKNNKIKVTVTGDGVNYSSRYSVTATTSGTVAAADIPVTGVSFDRTSLTMWSNLDDDPDAAGNSVVGKTATLTAHVTPDDATPDPTYAWSVVKEDGTAWDGEEIITLATDTTETNTKEITAKKAGKVWVKVTVTGGEKADGTPSVYSATIPVTVNTGISSITLKQNGTELTSDSVLTIYANDGDANKSVTVNAEVNDGANPAGLVWSCSHTGADHIFQLGGAEDAGSANGGTVTITAYDNHTLVGEETVTVSAPSTTGNTAESVSFKVKVVHKINTTEHSVSIAGTPKVGTELSVNLQNLPMSDADKGKLTYQWKRDDEDISGATASKYTPKVTSETDTDVGATISVVVKATPADGFYYSGELTATATAAVEKKDAPATPTLSPTKPTTEGGSDGYITITNYVSGQTYQIKIGDDGSWNDVTVTGEGKIEGLAADKYSVKVKATDDQKESAAATVTVAAGDATEYDITVTQPTEGATINVTDKSVAGETVTITLTVDTDYEVTAVTVTDADNGTVTATVDGEDTNKYTFEMPAKTVTVTATVSKRDVKITHNLSEGLSCSLTEHDADGNHVVKSGEVQEITLTAAEGYNLPAAITVKYTDDDETVPTERCEYNSSNGKITFPEGIQRHITITANATAKTFTAAFDPASGGNLTRAVTSATPIAYNTDLTATLTPAEGYSAPAKTAVEVTVGGTAADFEYVMDTDTGVATVTVKNVKGNVVIKAAGAVKDTTEVTAVTIGIGHNDATATGDVPHVGDLLTATVTPANADVDIQWYAGDEEISGATQATYRIDAAYLGKTIKVKVTGTGDYSGEVTSAATAAVENFVKLPTGITLDQTTATVEYKKTLTLTATVAPADATDKTVTWTSSNTDVATVAGGVVTPVNVGETIITAADAAGNHATCTVTVTAAQVSVTLAGVAKVGQTLTATLDPSDATYRSIIWCKVDGNGDNVGTLSSGSSLTYTITEDALDYKVGVIVDATGNYTGNSAITSDKVVGENVELPTHTITITTSENGTVTADKEAASAGEVVTLTVTPATGYELGTLTVTDASNAPVTVAADNTFVMPNKNVTVAATFTQSSGGEEPPVVVTPTGVSLDKTEASVSAGSTIQLTATLEPGDATGELEWTSSNDEIATVDATGKVTGVAESEETVTITVKVKDTDLTATCTVTVTKAVVAGSVGKQPSNTTTTPNPDGSTTVTETKPDGTKVATTEKPDGTKETVETKKDGTVTATTESPDGTKEVVETKPDGTKTETVETPDGAKEIVETKPDGTVTETAIDPEGAKTEKVTDPEENVTITVTDPEGEELVKVELPAEIPAPETKFEDVPEDHWAESAINTVAGLGLVKGVENDRYDMVTPMDRGSLATILYRLSNGKSDYAVSFTDVAEGKYYTEGVAWAAKVGVVTGISKDIFAPEQVITREQLAVMLARYAKLIGMDTKAETSSLNAFTDSDKTGTWAVDSVAWCIEKGILRGKGGNVLDPAADVTRAEVAVMLERFIGLMK